METVFPCIIFMKGTMDALTWWVKQPNGVDAGPLATFEDAFDAATSYNDRCNHPAPVQSVVLRKVKLGEDESESFVMEEEIPFDCYGLYAVTPDGYIEHLEDYFTWATAVNARSIAQYALHNQPGLDYYRLLEVLHHD